MTTINIGFILVAGIFAGLMVLPVVVVGRGRRTGTARIFGRQVHRPGLWAAGVWCMGLAGLVLAGNIFDVTPSGWQGAGRVVHLVLTVAFVVLLIAQWVAAERDRRR